MSGARVSVLGKEAEHWNEIARKWDLRSYSNALLAEHKRKTYLDLIARWADVAEGQRILKTDLFTEAFGPEQFIFDVARANGNIVGIDISDQIVDRAREQAIRHAVDATKYLCCNVKQLPFQDDSFDLIISDSTLDHFPGEVDISTALKELTRVLRAGGILILTIDNKSNLTYPPYMLIRLWMKLGVAPYFIGKTLSPSRLRHTLEGLGLSVEENTAIFHYPHPDAIVRWLECSLRQFSRGRLDNAIRKSLTLLDRLGKMRTRYLTGRYLAVKAVKKEIH